jgi:hypothetical protein
MIKKIRFNPEKSFGFFALIENCEKSRGIATYHWHESFDINGSKGRAGVRHFRD